MKNSKTKKLMALFLSVLTIITMIPIAVSAAEYPVMEKYTAASSGDYHKYYNKVVTVTFLDSIDNEDIASADTLYSWDVSAAKDGSVMAWMKNNTEETSLAGADRYDVYIAGEGGVGANPSSTHVFYLFSQLKEVKGLENFKTGNATDMSYMFGGCNALEKLDLSSFDTSSVTKMHSLFRDCKVLSDINIRNWDTSNVTTMAYMFSNCHALTELDLSSFETAKVTNMERMFYTCTELKNIYIGDGWNTAAVTNSNAMFNCCYAIVGGKDIYDRDFQYVAPTVEYAKLREEGGFLDRKPEAKKFTVTYILEGDIPEEYESLTTITVIAEEGTEIDVMDSYSAEGYEFSGWTSEDEDITTGSFTLTKDVTIKGRFDKLYTVTYKYDESFPVPEGAPELPAAAQYKAGTDLDRFGVPYVDGYVFVGWTTDDVEVFGDMYEMPENDVVFYGYFKKPVESVEFFEEDKILNIDDEPERLNVYVRPDDATIKDLVYESSDETVVKVDKYGNITPVGEGEATVTVTSKDDPTKTDTITVTVKIPVTDIEVDKKEITLKKDGTDIINVTAVTPSQATNKKVNYVSEDETVAKVDEDGNITAVGEGTTTIIVSSDDNPDVKEIITVTVKNPVTEITAKDDFTIDIGKEDSLDAKVNEDATNKELIYESDRPDVVKVDSDGDIIAVGEGTAIITITSKDDPTVTEKVTVTVKVPVEDVTTDRKDITLDVGKKDKITVSFTPENPTDKGLTYESSDETVVKVDEEGNIEAVGEGTATIKVTSKDNPGEFVEVKVTVEVPVEDVTTDREEITLDVGKKDKITVSFTPENPTDKGLTYESSDETVVKVDEEGNIEAVGEGTATIKVTSKDDPTKSTTIEITVERPLVNYIVEHYLVTDDWSEYSSPDKTESFSGRDGDKVVAVPGTFSGYAYNFFKSVSEGVLKEGESDTVVLKLYYEPDKIGGTDGRSDGIPDKYQKLIAFEVRNGKWDDGTSGRKYAYVTLLKDGKWDVNGEGVVNIPAVGSNPDEGYKAGSWNKDFVVESNDKDVYIYTYAIIPTEPENPTPDEPVDPENPDTPSEPEDPQIPDITIPMKHYICFGKTDGIGWYEVSVNGGDFFLQGPNSTLEVEEGSVIVVRTQDMWIDDDFTFYVNGSKVEEIAPNTIMLTVDGYMLIGALSMDVEVPDAGESLNLFEKIIKGIKDFFEKIFSLFKKK